MVTSTCCTSQARLSITRPLKVRVTVDLQTQPLAFSFHSLFLLWLIRIFFFLCFIVQFIHGKWECCFLKAVAHPSSQLTPPCNNHISNISTARVSWYTLCPDKCCKNKVHTISTAIPVCPSCACVSFPASRPQQDVTALCSLLSAAPWP